MSEPVNLTLSAIMVSYNTRELTLKCLRSLFADCREMSAEVWVVDNASTDGTVDAIRREFPFVKLIANDNNIGFGAANNQAMREASGEYFLLTNSDAVIESGAVAGLIDYLKRHPHVAAVGPRMLNEDGTLQMSCYPFPSLLRAWIDSLSLARFVSYRSALGDFRSWDHDSERIVPWVIGACMLVRRSVYQQIGGFDERFFLYAEETDWQRRMRLAGWEIGFTPSASVTHLAGASGSYDRVRSRDRFFTSHDAYHRKHYGLLGLLVYRLAMLFGCAWRITAWSIAYALAPSLRPRARKKVALNSWLLARQMRISAPVP